MDITTLAAWGEFIGGIAVVISLVYLAGQIRQHSRLLLTSSMSTTNQQPSTQNILRVQEPEVARIFWEGITDRDLLSTDDRGRFDPLLAVQFHTFRQQFQFERQSG